MPWEEMVPRPHNCTLDGGLPDADKANKKGAWEGSTFRCGVSECGRLWTLERLGVEDWKWTYE